MYYLNRFKFISSFKVLDNPQALREYLNALNEHIIYMEKEFTPSSKYYRRNLELLSPELNEYNKRYSTKYQWYGAYIRSLYLHREKVLKKVRVTN